jgi:hypothetical protein
LGFSTWVLAGARFGAGDDFLVAMAYKLLATGLKPAEARAASRE